MPVDTDEVPEPSRSTATSIAVSLVVRLIDALRMLQFQSASFQAIFAVKRLGLETRVPPAFYQGPAAFATAAGKERYERLMRPLRSVESARAPWSDPRRTAGHRRRRVRRRRSDAGPR